MGRKIDRIGEERVNKFGSKMVITGYRNARDVDVYFSKYDWTFKHTQYSNFKKGEIKCPYEPRIYGIGYFGEGKYKAFKNGKKTDEYYIWYNMLQRCYDSESQEKNLAYKDCKVENYLLNFQHMAEWIEENYYEVHGEQMCLDKDILHKGNKVYSRETCIFVPQKINSLFIKNDNSRGKNPIGVSDLPSGNYRAMCSDGYGKQIHLGVYTSKEKAFQVYKQYKERIIKETINSYEGKML